jgi:hypothetical protein
MRPAVVPRGRAYPDTAANHQESRDLPRNAEASRSFQ